MTHGNARPGGIAAWTDVLVPVAVLARRRFRDPGLNRGGRAPVRWTNVDPKIAPDTEGEAEWVASQRKWTCGWRRLALLAIPLVYLTYVADAIGQNSHGAAAVAGYAVLAAFAACWLAMPLAPAAEVNRWRFWAWYAALVALFLAELPFAHAAAFVMCVFVTIATVARLGARSAPVVAALALGALLVPVAIGSWHVGLAAAFDTVTPVAIPIVALSVFAALRVVRGNQALAEARAELARLAAENERIRIARDLHDLLGHSLTTITVKAGLAHQLGAVDAARAIEQIAEVEALSRQSLADVRAAVSGYREVTLASELARGRELLRASGIAADLPAAADVVDPANQELFGWAVREGLTNVIRHSRASSCAVRLSPSSMEITDDGIGAAAQPGNGLRGLRERVAAAGGTLDAGPLQPRGWQLRIWMPPAVARLPADGAPGAAEGTPFAAA
jgi:two-component system sensor histidine kinase DesK